MGEIVSRKILCWMYVSYRIVLYVFPFFFFFLWRQPRAGRRQPSQPVPKIRSSFSSFSPYANNTKLKDEIDFDALQLYPTLCFSLHIYIIFN